MKLPLTLIAAFVWIGVVVSASASSVQFFVTPNNLDQGQYVFVVSNHAVKTGAAFKITITRKTSVIAPDCHASFAVVPHVKDGGFSAQRAKDEPHLTLKKEEKSWEADFIASNDALKSPDLYFIFSEPCPPIVVNGQSVRMPCVDMYLLKLQDFWRHALDDRSAAGIIYPAEPTGGREMVFNELSGTLKSDARFLGGIRAEEITVGEPYPCYYVGLTNLAAGQLLSAAKVGGWMCPFLQGTNAVGAGGLIADEATGKAMKPNGIYKSDFSRELQAALRMAAELPQVKKGDYEVRRLDSPGILFAAAWLHGKTDDIIIPLGITFGRWQANRPYSEKEMIRLLKPEAAKKLKAPPGFGKVN